MRHIPQHRSGREVVCRVATSWRRELAPGAIVGLPAGGGIAHRHRIPGHKLSQRARRQRQRLA
jgi:hypothetical protein